jgi:hypothetical protein
MYIGAHATRACAGMILAILKLSIWSQARTTKIDPPCLLAAASISKDIYPKLYAAIKVV